MLRATMILGTLLLVVGLAACGSGGADTTAAPSNAADTALAARTPGARPFDDTEMPLSMKLPLGTLMLEQTAYAVTPAQAQELLPLWQMLGALQESATASQVEIDAILDQIQGAMTPEQLAAIEEMSPEEMRTLFQDLGMRRQGDSDTDEEGGFRPPEGMMPPGAGEGPPAMGPMGPGGFGDLSPEEQSTAMAERGGAGMGFGRAFTDQVIELLETRAAES